MVVRKVVLPVPVALAVAVVAQITTLQPQQGQRTQAAEAVVVVLQAAMVPSAALAVPVLSSFEFAPLNSFNY